MKMSPLFVSKERKNILSKEEVYELLEKYKNGDKSAQDKIVEHNKQMVIDIALSFKNSPYEQQELIAVGLEALLKVIKKFDCNKNVSFATFAYPVIRNDILMFMRNNKKFLNDISLSQSIFNSKNVGDDLIYEETLPDEKAFFEEKLINSLNTPPPDLKELLKNSIHYLSLKEYQVIRLRYDLENNKIRTQNEIGKILKVSRGYISRLELSAIKKIREYYNNEEKKEIPVPSKNTDFSFILFHLSSIHKNLTFPVFAKLLSLFPKWEQDLFIKLYNIDLEKEMITKHKIKTTENTLKYAEIIEDNLKEMFLYYEKIRKAKQLTEKESFDKVKKHMMTRSLRFQFPNFTQKKLLENVKKLKEEEQNILYLRFGHHLFSFHEFPKDGTNYYQKLSKAIQHLHEILENKYIIHPKSILAKYSNYSFLDLDCKIKLMPKKYQEILYLRNGASLNDYHPYPKFKSYTYYYLLNQEAETFLSDLLHDKNPQFEEKKTIITTYTKEELNYALPRLRKIEQEAIYIRHTKNLNVTLPWSKELNGKSASYYANIYFNCYATIEKLLKEREEKRKYIPLLDLLGNYTFEEVKKAFLNLKQEEQQILYERHGKDLLSFFPFRTPSKTNKLVYESALRHLKEILRFQKSENTKSIAQKKQELVLQKTTLIKDQNRTLKNELFTLFFKKYKSILSAQDLVDFINDLFKNDVRENKEYYILKLDRVILLHLINVYKNNPYSENSTFILQKVIDLFSRIIGDHYSYLSKEKIKKTIEHVFLSYTGENTFEEEVIQALKIVL